MIKVFNVCYFTLKSTLTIVQILSTPCIGGWIKAAKISFFS
jgi:hypothetical protein